MICADRTPSPFSRQSHVQTKAARPLIAQRELRVCAIPRGACAMVFEKDFANVVASVFAMVLRKSSRRSLR